MKPFIMPSIQYLQNICFCTDAINQFSLLSPLSLSAYLVNFNIWGFDELAWYEPVFDREIEVADLCKMQPKCL